MYAMGLYELIIPRDGRIAYSEQNLAQTGVFMRHAQTLKVLQKTCLHIRVGVLEASDI